MALTNVHLEWILMLSFCCIKVMRGNLNEAHSSSPYLGVTVDHVWLHKLHSSFISNKCELIYQAVNVQTELGFLRSSTFVIAVWCCQMRYVYFLNMPQKHVQKSWRHTDYNI